MCFCSSRWQLFPIAALFALAFAARPGRADTPAPARPDDVALERLHARARALGFTTWNQQRGEHFQIVGDVEPVVLRATSQVLDKLADEFVAHFRARGFRVALPPYWLSAVVLEGHKEYQTYVGHANLGNEWRFEHISGIYIGSLNYCFFFDSTPRGKRSATGLPSESDLKTWVHEAAHELCYNTGLVPRWTDAPKAMTEGLAEYCEDHRLSAPSPIGGIDSKAVRRLSGVARKGQSWIALDQLLVDDEILSGRDGGERVDQFYGEGWALVHLLMTRHTEGFRSYMEVLPRRGPDAPDRLELARRHLGDLEQLDKELKQYAEEVAKVQFKPAVRRTASPAAAPGGGD
jgi:hypothetical protein